MRTYETIFIVHPETAGDAYTEIVDKYKGILNELGASIIAVEEWGTRKLAYNVQKEDRGTYVLVAYEGKPEGIRELERRFRIDDKIIKFMTVQLEGSYEPSGYVRKVEEAEAAAPAAEEAAPAPAEEPKAEAAPAAKEEPAAEEAPAEEAATEEAAPAESEEESA